MRIEVWYDYICPWCYAALDRADYLEERHGAELRWRPFELHPDWPAEGMRAPRYERAGILKQLIEQTELPFSGRRTVTNSFSALALSTSLQRAAWWPAFHRRLFEAYWVEDRNLGSAQTLRELGDDFGLTGDAVEDAIEKGIDLVLASKDEALELGVSATPGWHFGNGVVFPGVHEPGVFDRIISRLSSRRAPSTRSPCM